LKNLSKKNSQPETLHSIDLRIAHRLKEPEFRREWFRVELESSVPLLFRSLREKRSLTQSKLAKLTGMKQSAISRFEVSTEANWNVETLQTMAEAMDGRLFIGLETAEDVIERVEREERQAAVSHRSAADRSADENTNSNKIGKSALNHLSRKLEELKPMTEGENRPWN
jgi:transcriptional regulator with XRE-family HTH domain